MTRSHLQQYVLWHVHHSHEGRMRWFMCCSCHYCMYINVYLLMHSTSECPCVFISMVSRNPNSVYNRFLLTSEVDNISRVVDSQRIICAYVQNTERMFGQK